MTTAGSALFDTSDGPDGEPIARLLGGRCRSCGRTFFPRAPVCPYDGEDQTDDVVLPSAGTLWGWTAVTAAPPGYLGPVPYGVGVVELEDGLRVVGRITEADPSALSFGQPMTTVTERLPTDGDPMSVWAFAPAGDAA